MAQLKDSIVQGSLRVTDTIYTTDLILSSGTASQILKTDANKKLITGTLTKDDVGLGNLTNNTYSGGTAITLNGTSKSASTASFYAPTSAGTAGQYLKSDGTGKTPVWSALPTGSTSASGIIQLTDSYTSTDSSKATTGKALLAALQTLDSTLPSGSSAGKTLTALTITDGKMAAATFSDINISKIFTEGDNRSNNTMPDDYQNNIIFRGIKYNWYIDNPTDGSNYSYLLGLRGWENSSGGKSHEFAFNNYGIFWRMGATTTWDSWYKIIATASQGNINDVLFCTTNSYGTWKPFTRMDIQPVQSKTYTDVTVTGNADPAGWLYFFKACGTGAYNDIWKLTYRVTASCAGQADSKQVSIVHIDGVRNTYVSYWVWNSIGNTSYRPFYAHPVYWRSANNTSTQNQYAPIIGLRFQSSYEPTNTTYKRTITFDILETENCAVTFFDTGTLYSAVEGTGSTNFNTSRSAFDGTTQGITISGDRNTTSISAVYGSGGTMAPETSANGGIGLYRYTLHLMTPNYKWSSVAIDSAGVPSTNYPSAAQPKSPATCEFLINTPILYSDTDRKLAPGATANTYTEYQNRDIEFRYNAISSSVAWSNFTHHKPVYLVGLIQPSGNFKLHATRWWTQDPNITTYPESNTIFIYLGMAYDNTHIYLSQKHPIYKLYGNTTNNAKLDLYNPTLVPLVITGTMMPNESTTINDGRITPNHIVLYSSLDHPAYQTSDWTVTTTTGSVTITGSVSAQTNFTITLGVTQS